MPIRVLQRGQSDAAAVDSRSQELAERAVHAQVARWRWREPDVLVEQQWPAAELGALPEHSRVWVVMRQRPLDALRALTLDLPLSDEQRAAARKIVEDFCEQMTGFDVMRAITPWVTPHRVTLSSGRGLLRLSFRATHLSRRSANALPASLAASAIWTATDLEEGARVAADAWCGERPLPSLCLRRPSDAESLSSCAPSHAEQDEATEALLHLGGLVHSPGAFGDVDFPLLLLQIPGGAWAQTERLCRRVGMDPGLPVDVCPAGAMCPTGTAALFCLAIVTQCVDVTHTWLRRAFGGVFRRRVVILCCERDRRRVPSPPAGVSLRSWHLDVDTETMDDETLWHLLLGRALPWLAHGVAVYLESRVED